MSKERFVWKPGDMIIEGDPAAPPELSRAQQKAIQDYQTADQEVYQLVREHMEGQGRDPLGRRIANQLKVALEPPLEDGLTVFRGARFGPELMSKLKKGAVLSDKSFVSSSKDSDLAIAFIDTRQGDDPAPKGSQGVLFELTTKKAKGRSIAPIDYGAGETINESEVLFQHGAKIKILSVKSGGKTDMGTDYVVVRGEITHE